jgi:hypothetical protein
MGMFGCSNDNPSHSNQNGISAPAPETPENTTYTLARNRSSLILGGVNAGTGAPDPACGIDITVRDQSNTNYIVDAVVELRWNVSDYPNRSICISGIGTTYSLSGGVYHVYTTTDASGGAHFRVAGFYTGSTGSCGGGEGSTSTPRKVRLFVDGDEQTISGGWCNVSTADYDQANGVNSADLSLFLTDKGCANYYSRSDFDGDGDVDSDDQAILTNIITGGNSTVSCGE